ncbi:MAG TPA: RidA family protein [Phototrophicaceae bacterium]|nr:RidA family protein [Phototrophicaceae bacterium]
MPQHRFINPETIAPPTGYTHVVETRGSRTVYISGQVGLDAQGNLIGEGDMRAQAEQVFKNLQAALAAVGATFADVVKFTYFLVDMSQLQAVRDVRNQYVNPAQLPASTAVEVRRLFRPELLLEVEAIAVLD